MKRSVTVNIGAPALAACLLVGLVGCATTRHVNEDQQSEFLDGQSGQRVSAAVDARAGTKALRTKFNSTCNDAKLAFEWWGQRIDKRLMLFKQGDFGTENL